MPETYTVALILFLAILAQSFLGFGSAMLSMSLLPRIIPLTVAAPLYILVALIMEIALFLVFRRAFNFQAIRRITLATVLGVPIGVFLLNQVPEQVSLTIIGGIILLYALYALLNFRVPPFQQRGWAYGLGLAAGALGWAYTILGPPIILYGHGKGWSDEAFKANLQAFLGIGSLAILVGYAVTGSYTSEVWDLFWYSLPAGFLGVALGVGLGKLASPVFLQKSVLAGLAMLGISMMG